MSFCDGYIKKQMILFFKGDPLTKKDMRCYLFAGRYISF